MIRYLAKVSLGLETLLYLVVAKSLIVVVPFRWWSSLCGTYQSETLRTEGIEAAAEIARLRRAVLRIGRYVPWRSQCLDRAMAIQFLLYRRHLSSTLYLGMEKNVGGEWKAHAWVRCGPHWAIGYSSLSQFSVVGTYAKYPPGERSSPGLVPART